MGMLDKLSKFLDDILTKKPSEKEVKPLFSDWKDDDWLISSTSTSTSNQMVIGFFVICVFIAVMIAIFYGAN
jgi:hypothetical protein